ncbi:MAG: hypothetical protein H9864_00050, partial [Candidatus Faecalibacterium intestinavium]|nr:hypothetical protein [Candidatus Faecalibacterium intestinavium]
LVVLHDPALALRWCSRAVLMREGVLCGQLRPEDGPEQVQAALSALYPGIRVYDSPGGLFCTMDRPEKAGACHNAQKPGLSFTIF